MSTVATLHALAGFQILNLIVTMAFYYIVAVRGDRHIANRMRDAFGRSGFTSAWTGEDGKRYRYDLANGRIVRA